jgi:hypothetical protein
MANDNKWYSFYSNTLKFQWKFDYLFDLITNIIYF